VDPNIVRLLESGGAAAAEIPSTRSGHRGFLRANKLPEGGYVIVRFEMSESVIRELEDRWERNEDFVNKQSATVSEARELDSVLQQWGLDPNILVPAWQVDFP
jgi:hypothetical protein